MNTRVPLSQKLLRKQKVAWAICKIQVSGLSASTVRARAKVYVMFDSLGPKCKSGAEMGFCERGQT